MAYLHMLLTVFLGLFVTRSVLGLTFGFPYGKEKVRGVNLGGWLVLEVGTRENSMLSGL
jgi:glucan 1,3-beta-glucosidase